ncbi:MAG: CmcI family methyltransferase [Pseudomonadota bacterium]
MSHKFGQTNFPPSLNESFQKGIMSTRYNGRAMWKCPMDLVIYRNVLENLLPKTIFEFGSNEGGSAMWLADQLTSIGLHDTRLFSLDVNPVTDIDDPRIEFGFCNVEVPQDCFNLDDLKALPHPILIIDDASHRGPDVLSLLKYIDQIIEPGDYLIVEDGILTHLDMPGYDGGPLWAIEELLKQNPGRYEVDRAVCDTYGTNVTWNPEGYIRCIANR